MADAYKQQVALLLDVLPAVGKESCFALHGGTAINLFIRDMPRLSVDIDLTYVPIEDRESSLAGINQALLRIKDSIESLKPAVHIVHREETCKLLIADHGVQIKVEVNVVGRGVLGLPEKTLLCAKAQSEFDVFCALPLLPMGQLYGGKICAALDRQHPRDIFDIKLLLDNEGFTESIKHGFLLCLISSSRPIHEILKPRLQDQRVAFANQFEGMSRLPFTYDEYEQVRSALITTIGQRLLDEDKQFLVGVNTLKPDWGIYDFERFPAVQWKLKNLAELRDNNPEKYRGHCDSLRSALNFTA